MGMTRRHAILTGFHGLGAAFGASLVGCAAGGSGRSASRPGAVWPGATARPKPYSPTPIDPVPHPPKSIATVDPIPRGVPSTPAGLKVLPRSAWTRKGPAGGDINPMRGITRITVHHEGWTPVYFADRASTAARLEKIRAVHTRDRGWADIGYHFVIDRSGRFWQARDLRYQGAHVRDQNEHNIGILVLGNFDKQSPSKPQTASLVDLLKTLQSAYRVPKSRVRTHREYNPTSCPGRVLQAQMNAIRQRFLA